MKKRIYSIILCVAMLFSMSTVAFAAESSVGNNAMMLSDVETVNISSEVNTDIQSAYATRPRTALGNVAATVSSNEDALTPAFASLGTQPCNSFSVTLGQNEVHFLTFNVTSSRVMFSKLASSDTDYVMALYTIDGEGNLNQATGFYAPGSELKIILASGQYAFAILSGTESYGSSYTLYVNTSTPGSNVTGANIHRVNSTYSHIVALVMESGSPVLYCDGVKISDLNDTSSLDWERILDLSWSSGYNYNKHEISNVQIAGVSLPGTYNSDYVDSNNAVIIFLAAGTNYMYNESQRNWDTGYSLFHFLDPFGNETPRSLTDYDIANYQCYLVFDLNTGKSIDFWSALNWYYATGTETASFTYHQ